MADFAPTSTITTIATISTHVGTSPVPTVFTNPLTTQYTPPADCLANTYVWGSGSAVRVEVAPDFVPSCWPAPYPSLSGSLSPAFCPAGYTIASLSAYLGRFVASVDVETAALGSYTETILTCCPSLTHPFSGVDSSNQCRYSVSDAIATEVVTLARFESLSGIVTSGGSAITQTNWTTTLESTTGLDPIFSAPALRVAFQATDQHVLDQWSASVVYAEPVSSPPPPLPSSAAATSFSFPTNTGSGGGGSTLSGGSVAFVAIGAVLGLLIIICVIYFTLRWRKNKKKSMEEITETGVDTNTNTDTNSRSGLAGFAGFAGFGGGNRPVSPEWKTPEAHEMEGQVSPQYARNSQLSGQTAAVEMPTSDFMRAELPAQVVPPKDPAELPTPVQSRRPSQ